MPKRITQEQREAVLHMLAEGHDRDSISAALGVTPGQVSAVSAHVKMGTYSLPDVAGAGQNGTATEPRPADLLQRLEASAPASNIETQFGSRNEARLFRIRRRRIPLPK